VVADEEIDHLVEAAAAAVRALVERASGGATHHDA
jgi:hypothetical protein